MTSRRVGLLVLALVLSLPFTAGCENRVNATQQCLGWGSVTERYRNTTFEIGSGPALDVAGNCHVILNGSVVRSPQGFRVREHGVIEMRGGSLTAGTWAVDAAGDARVIFEGVQLSGEVRRADRAVVQTP
jgi:hypothetical protein